MSCANIPDNIIKRYEKSKEEAVRQIDEYFYLCASRCESPIEQLMVSEIITLSMYEGIKDNKDFDRFCPQYKVGPYRVDIALFIDFPNRRYKLAIECDGHDYHERTEKQARRDKKRDG